MAAVQCPNCQCQFKSPTNVVAWVIGLLGALMLGGFLLVVVCLAAVAAVGAAADDDEHLGDQVRIEARDFGSTTNQQIVKRRPNRN